MQLLDLLKAAITVVVVLAIQNVRPDLFSLGRQNKRGTIKMSPKNKKLLLGGIAIALVIAILAPFLASSNPDGLDSTAQKVMQNPETEPAFESPLPDYTIPFLGEENPLGGVIALVLGTLLVLGIAYGLGAFLKRKMERKIPKFSFELENL